MHYFSGKGCSESLESMHYCIGILSYDKLKDSYREILTEDDIRECFQNDDIKTEMKRTIDRSVRIYLIIWGGILLSLLILVEYMSSEPFIWPILKSLFQITKK